MRGCCFREKLWALSFNKTKKRPRNLHDAMRQKVIWGEKRETTMGWREVSKISRNIRDARHQIVKSPSSNESKCLMRGIRRTHKKRRREKVAETAEFIIPTFNTSIKSSTDYIQTAIYRVRVDKVNYTCTISTWEDRQVSIAIFSSHTPRLSLKNFPTTSTAARPTIDLSIFSFSLSSHWRIIELWLLCCCKLAFIFFEIIQNHLGYFWVWFGRITAGISNRRIDCGCWANCDTRKY